MDYTDRRRIEYAKVDIHGDEKVVESSRTSRHIKTPMLD
jgi:hypothetical protein